MPYRAKKWPAAALLAIMMSVSQMASAALVERAGGQAFYDTVLNITWLTNANLAQSENFGSNDLQMNEAVEIVRDMISISREKPLR